MEIANIIDNCIILGIREDIICARDIYGQERGVYGAVRWAWEANFARASRAKYVLAVKCGTKGKIVGVFKPQKWYWATAENDIKYGHNLNRSEKDANKIAFIGDVAEDEVVKRYLNKYVPPPLTPGQNPIRYNFN